MQINISISVIEITDSPRPSRSPDLVQGPLDTPLKKLAQGAWVLFNMALMAWAMSWFM